MATLARPSDHAPERIRDLPAASPVTRRQSAEAVGLLVGLLLVLLAVALSTGAPIGIGQ